MKKPFSIRRWVIMTASESLWQYAPATFASRDEAEAHMLTLPGDGWEVTIF
jgi:hypothetical protein